MKSILRKYLNDFNFYLLIFFLVNLLQAIFTPIGKDEAYYWVYSQNLAWGYFDHPPLVAVIIKIGTLIFSSEIGVRLMTVILTTFSLSLIWKIIPEKNKTGKNSVILFFLLIFSIPVFNIYGFFTTPDVPLLFFAVLYLYIFEKFVKNSNLLNTLLLGLCAALLIYSKYHGGILIIISILSQIKILKKYNIYLAGIVSVLLIVPHILWQINNDFATFDYHLNQRTDGSIKISNIINYLVGMFTILNPALLILIAILSVKKKIDVSNKSLNFTLWGFLIFFFIYSFRGKIEAQWIAISAIPLVILLHDSILKSEKLVKISKFIFIPSIIIILIFRILIILPLPLKTEFHQQKKTYYQAIKKAADGKKVVFVNSYQEAAKYSFYTRENSISLNNVSYRKNQYDIGNFDYFFNNQKVFLVGNWNSAWLDTMKIETGDIIYYNIVKRLPVISKLKVKIKTENFEIINSVENQLEISITNPYNFDQIFNSADMPYILFILLIDKDKTYTLYFSDINIETVKANSTEQFILKFTLSNIPEKEYKMLFLLKPGYIYEQVVSKTYKVNVKN